MFRVRQPLRPLALALGLGLTMNTAALAADVLVFNDFSSTAGLQINGHAAQVGNVLRVTPAIDNRAGSVFSTNAVSLANNASFSTNFSFRFSNPDQGFCDGGPVCGADGLVFVLQTVSNSVGGVGGGIGYFGLQKSVAIEFDTWNNGGDPSIQDINSNHVGLDVNGSLKSLLAVPVTEADLNGGDVWNAWIDYDGGNHQIEVRLTRSADRPASALLTYTRDLALDLQSNLAFVGFTSGTGLSHANHDLLSWTLRNDFDPIGVDPDTPPTGNVPTPASLPLVLAGIGLAAVATVRPRRRRV
jgi:Legume lectin domain